MAGFKLAFGATLGIAFWLFGGCAGGAFTPDSDQPEAGAAGEGPGDSPEGGAPQAGDAGTGGGDL